MHVPGAVEQGARDIPPAVRDIKVIIHTLRDVVTICYLKFSSSPPK